MGEAGPPLTLASREQAAPQSGPNLVPLFAFCVIWVKSVASLGRGLLLRGVIITSVTSLRGSREGQLRRYVRKAL